jgi:hypothetical protein
MFMFLDVIVEVGLGCSNSSLDIFNMMRLFPFSGGCPGRVAVFHVWRPHNTVDVQSLLPRKT